MATPLYVIGHRNPDTDSICAALGLAELLRRQRQETVIAGRAGPLRPETLFLLERFHVEPPLLVQDVHVRVGDVMTTPATCVSEDESLYEVGRKQQELGMRPLPVIDSGGRLRGIVEATDFAKVFFTGLDVDRADQVAISMENLVRALDARVIVAAEERNVRRKVMVAAWSFESIMLRLEPDIVLVVGDRTDVQMAAIEFGVGMLIVTGGTPVLPEVADFARQRGVRVMAVEHHTAATLRLVQMSIPVSDIMRRNPPSGSPDDLVDDVRSVFTTERALTIVDEDEHVIGVVSRGDIIRSARRRVVLVDHNERAQAVDGIEQADIVGIVDHHRVADIQTVQPPFMRVEPVGACSTLVAKLFEEAGERIPGPLAGALLGAIVTDTLLFKSPTTTDEDRRIAAALGRLASVDPSEVGQSVLAIASDLSHRGADELVNGDFKAFTLDGLRFGVGVIETGNAAAALDRKDELRAAMRKVRGEEFASVLLVITDVVHDATTILVEGQADAVARAFGGERAQPGELKLRGVYSRKKQVVPTLSRVRDLIKGRV